MKVLVDTSVWALALRRKSADLNQQEVIARGVLEDLIRTRRAALIGLIRQELLSGLKEKTQFEQLRKALEPFSDEPATTADHEEAARCYNLRRSEGLACGPVDILICAMAKRRRWKVYSHDSGLNRCAEILGVRFSQDRLRSLSTSPPRRRPKDSTS